MADTVTEVAPGIFQLKVPIPENPLGYTLPYLVTGPEGHILVDTGMRSRGGVDAFRDQLVGQLGVKPGAVKLILITHNHPDHAGLAREAKEFTGAPIAMHQVDWETMSGMRMAMQPGGTERVRSWYLSHGVPPEETEQLFPHRPRRPSPEEEAARAAAGHHGERPSGEGGDSPHRDPHAGDPPDILLKGGETFSTGAMTLEAVWTPGHTPGHLCFYERRNRYLFTGDHILPIITSNVSLFLGADGRNPLGEYLESVEKVGGMDVGLVLPAHEHHFVDLRGRVAQLQRHHDARLAAVLRAVSGQPKTAYAIASQVPWDVGTWVTMDPGLRRAAVGETLSHLAHLQRQGKVQVGSGDSLVMYSLAGVR